MKNPFKRNEEERKAEKKQLKNLDKRLTRTESRLNYLERTVQVMRRES